MSLSPAGCILIVVSVVIILFAFGVCITVFRKIFAKVRFRPAP